jgi:hypothetical protein
VLPGTFAKHDRIRAEASDGSAPWDSRPYDICVVGALDPVYYLIRAKLATWAEQGLFEQHGLRSKLLTHPGYTEEVRRHPFTPPPSFSDQLTSKRFCST